MNDQGNINSVEAKIICDSLVKIILDRATSKTTVPAFKPAIKRPPSTIFHGGYEKVAKVMTDPELSASKAREGQLQFELTLVTENLKFVTKDRDHWRLVADRARNEAETSLAKIHDFTLANMELTRMMDEQSGVCVEMMAMLTEMLWCSSQSSQLEIGSSLLNHFLQFSRRIIEQIDSDGKSSSGEKRKEKDLLLNIVGILVNLSSNVNCMKQLLGHEEMSSMLETLVNVINNANNQKMVHLVMMLASNMLSADFHFKDSREMLSEETQYTLIKIVSRWSKGDKTGSRLREVASRLETCLKNNRLGGVEQ